MLNKKQQDEFYEKLGKRIRAARLNEKVKQEELAQYLGFKTRVSIVNIEKGRQKLLVHTLVEIASYLRTEMSELIPPVAEVKLTAKAEREVKKALLMIHDPDVGETIREIVKTHTIKKQQ